ncbi:MAG TPA: DUF2911 domain-containing protein [Vicinamibacteria bacterium]
MSLGRIGGWSCLVALSVALAVPALAQPPAERGKAEMKAGAGAITLDYGRPSLKGRDMLGQLKEGTFWRMGRNEATVLTTPVDLAFGTTRVAKGAYSLWLKKTGDSFELVLNSQTGQWGTQHDPAKDVASVAMAKSALPAAVETFTMGLAPAGKGGSLELTWGATKLAAPFEIAR